jgi:hypothetical protein
LFGTSSYALTASYLAGYVSPFPYSGSAQITGSLGVTGSVNITTNLYVGSTLAASGIQNIRQYNVDTSFLGGTLAIGKQSAANAGYTLDVSGSINTTGTLTITSASLNYQQNTNVSTGSTQVIASYPTGAYYAAFFDYAMYSGSAVRAGTIMTTWSGSTTSYNESYTSDFAGLSTSGVTLQTGISGSNIQLQATASTSAWTIRSLIRLL